MKPRLDQNDSLARRIANHALELQGLALATLLMIGSTGFLAGCQTPPRDRSQQAADDRPDPRNGPMNAAELEQSRAEIARELDTAVREGRISRIQADRFEIEALKPWLAGENASRRVETDRLRLYRSLVDGIMAGTLSGREAVSRLGAFNAVEGGDPGNNWVAGVWIEGDSVLFASPSGEFARGYLGRYTIEEDGVIKITLPTGKNTRAMRKQRQEDGTSKFVMVDDRQPAWNAAASRNEAGLVTLRLQPSSRGGKESTTVIELPLAARDSATFSPAYDRWIVGFWNTRLNNLPFSFCFFPDGICTGTNDYGVYKVDGKVATLKANGSRNLQRLDLQDDGSARLSRQTPGAGANRWSAGVTYTRRAAGSS